MDFTLQAMQAAVADGVNNVRALKARVPPRAHVPIETQTLVPSIREVLLVGGRRGCPRLVLIASTVPSRENEIS
jgi:hypothetical protein